VRGAVEGLGGSSLADGIACDVGDAVQVRLLAERAVSRFGHIDIWVNNAGLSGPYGPTVDVPDDQYRAVLQTNIFGTYHGSRVALEHFLRNGGEKLTNLLGRGDKQPVPLQNAYASSKAWVRAFTKALAEEYRDRNIGVFALNPGLVLTDMVLNVSAIAGYEDRMHPFETITRMWGKPPEVPAQRAVWLASGATDGKTGIEVRVLNVLVVVTRAARELIRRLKRALLRHDARTGTDRSLKVNTVVPAFDRTDRQSTGGV